MVNVGAHVDLSMLTNTTTTFLELVIKYDTNDYNVIFNDMVLVKWKKNHLLIFKNSLQKKRQKI